MAACIGEWGPGSSRGKMLGKLGPNSPYSIASNQKPQDEIIGAALAAPAALVPTPMEYRALSAMCFLVCACLYKPDLRERVGARKTAHAAGGRWLVSF